MMKLTLTGGSPFFANPRLVTGICPRKVRDEALDVPATDGRGVRPGYRVEGCIVSFGDENTEAAVTEDAEDVALEVADAIDRYVITDVAENARERARRAAESKARRASGECKAPAACACLDCIPF